MIKLPPNPFKIERIEENDPFVVNALRGRKHFEPCWCGSGNKFKRCHRNRENESPYSLGHLQNLQRKVFWKKRGCMHPSASPDRCSGMVIDSHTIQRKGPLKSIVDETGHVMHFEPDIYTGELTPEPISWRKASVFPGYCSRHDTKLFAPIEESKFTGSHLQCILHAFRNVCNELYRKVALIESLEFQRTCIDRGFDIDRQINAQLGCLRNIESQTRSFEESNSLRDRFETAIINENYNEFESKCYFFQGELEVVSSSVFQCEFDFAGNKLIDMWDLTLTAELLSHSIVNTEQGGAIIFAWLKEENAPRIVVESFDELSTEQKGDIFVQYCFINCENTFFSKKWWKKLSQRQKSLIHSYAKTSYYEGGSFEAGKNKLVNWEFNFQDKA